MIHIEAILNEEIEDKEGTSHLGARCDSRARDRVSYISSILLHQIRYFAVELHVFW